jgi:ABC-type Fe3+ transport system substrate-binding protein
VTQGEFDTQIIRLKDCFGERAYSNERVKLIWREVYQRTQKWMANSVDFFVSSRNTNQAPLPKDFADLAAAEREREWEAGKAARASEADRFWTDAPPGFFQNVLKAFPKSESGQ